jgi:hypothetical protein
VAVRTLLNALGRGVQAHAALEVVGHVVAVVAHGAGCDMLLRLDEPGRIPAAALTCSWWRRARAIVAMGRAAKGHKIAVSSAVPMLVLTLWQYGSRRRN